MATVVRTLGALGGMTPTQLAILAVLLKRLDGSVALTQAEFDEIAYGRIEENYDPQNRLYELTLIERKMSA